MLSTATHPGDAGSIADGALATLQWAQAQGMAITSQAWLPFQAQDGSVGGAEQATGTNDGARIRARLAVIHSHRDIAQLMAENDTASQRRDVGEGPDADAESRQRLEGTQKRIAAARRTKQGC